MSSIAGKKPAPELKELPPSEFYSKPERRSFSLPRHINRENAIKYKRQKLSSPVKARSPESIPDDHEMVENSDQQQQISERERRYQKRVGGAVGGRTFLEPSLPPLRRSASFRNVRKLFGQLFKPPKHSDPHSLQNGYIPRDSASQGSLSNYDAESPRNSPSRFSRLFEGRPVAVTGMYNHGNTCYINSVIQCLAATDLLSEYFITDRYRADLNPQSVKSRRFGTEGEITVAFAELLKSLWFSKYTAANSKHFTAVVQQWSRRRDGAGFSAGVQQDAQEFLSWLLEKVHEDLNAGTKTHVRMSKHHITRSEDHIADRSLEKHRKCNRSFVLDLLEAQFRSVLICPLCSHESPTFDPYFTVPLSVPQSTTRPLFVVMVYYNRKPRLLCLGLNADITATFGEVKHCLVHEAKIGMDHLILTELSPTGFRRPFRDDQGIASLGPDENKIYAVETPPPAPLVAVSPVGSASARSSQSASLVLIAVNARCPAGSNASGSAGTGAQKCSRFNHPVCMEIDRSCRYEDLHRCLISALKPQLRHGVSPDEVAKDSYRIKLSNHFLRQADYLSPEVEMPLYSQCVDEALASCTEKMGPRHLRIVLEWREQAVDQFFHPHEETVFDHVSACDLRNQVDHPEVAELRECLEKYTAPEVVQLEGWRCPNCRNQPSQAYKNFAFRSLPDVLIIHLKRFKQLPNGEYLKLHPLINFPILGLDMSPYLVASGGGPAKRPTRGLKLNGLSPKQQRNEQQLFIRTDFNHNLYDLYGVCNHLGESIHSGHYTAMCRNPIDAQWNLFDDEKVKPIDPSRVATKDAYILFYERRSASRTGSGHPSSESGYGEHWALRSRPETPRRSLSKNTLNGLETDDETTTSATAQPDQNSFHISPAQLKPLITLERLPSDIAKRAQKGPIPVAEVRLRPRQQQFSQRIKTRSTKETDL